MELLVNEPLGEMTDGKRPQNSVSKDTKMEHQAGESVEVKYEAMEEKDALSVKVEHREEPLMKEGEEFMTAVEH